MGWFKQTHESNVFGVAHVYIKYIQILRALTGWLNEHEEDWAYTVCEVKNNISSINKYRTLNTSHPLASE